MRLQVVAIGKSDASRIENYGRPHERSGPKGNRMQRRNTSHQRLFALGDWLRKEMRRGMYSSASPATERAGERLADADRVSSQTHRELEAEREEFLSTTAAPSRVALVRHGLSNLGSARRASPEHRLGQHAVDVERKGRKQRIVPFSFSLRKMLFRFMADFGITSESLLFATREGVQVRRMTALRSIKLLCGQLGFHPPTRTLHSFRHSFAVNYLRRGGSVFHLQKCLGHSSLEMTRRYANLVTSDLQAVHERVSLLSN
jgi:hypothetical protein